MIKGLLACEIVTNPDVVEVRMSHVSDEFHQLFGSCVVFCVCLKANEVDLLQLIRLQNEVKNQLNSETQIILIQLTEIKNN